MWSTHNEMHMLVVKEWGMGITEVPDCGEILREINAWLHACNAYQLIFKIKLTLTNKLKLNCHVQKWQKN